MRFSFFKAKGSIFPLSRSAVELFSSLSAIGMLWNGSVFVGVLTLEFAPPLHLCSVWDHVHTCASRKVPPRV